MRQNGKLSMRREGETHRRQSTCTDADFLAHRLHNECGLIGQSEHFVPVSCSTRVGCETMRRQKVKRRVPHGVSSAGLNSLFVRARNSKPMQRHVARRQFDVLKTTKATPTATLGEESVAILGHWTPVLGICATLSSIQERILHRLTDS